MTSDPNSPTPKRKFLPSGRLKEAARPALVGGGGPGREESNSASAQATPHPKEMGAHMDKGIACLVTK